MQTATLLWLLGLPTVISDEQSAFIPSFMLPIIPSRHHDTAAASCQPSCTVCLRKCPATRTSVVTLMAPSEEPRSFNYLLNDDNHDCYYSVDNNMIIYYENGNVPGWVDYVDHLSAKGKRFFVTNSMYMEYNKRKKISEYSLPSPFHRLDDPEASSRANLAYPELIQRFGLPPGDEKFATDARWILESGYCIAGCADIPEADIMTRGKTFAITANAKLVQRLLNSPEKREIFEMVVGRYGLEHLIDIRAVDMTGKFNDKYAF